MREPFIVDRPLTERDPFYGREELTRSIVSDLAAGRRLVMLFGKHRIGKTSLLNQLDLHLGSRYITHQISWQTLAAVTSSGHTRRGRGARSNSPVLMTLIASAVATALGETDELGRSLDNSDAALLRLSRTVEAAERASPTTVHVCCFDAVPVADLTAAQGWDATLRSLGNVLSSHSSLALIIAVEGRVPECSLDLAGLPVIPYSLEPLSAEDTSEMLLHLTEGAMHLDPEALRRVHMLSGGEPAFIQYYGRELHAAHPGYRWVSVAEVEGAAERIVEQATAEFETVWDGVTPIERVVMCVFAEHIGNQGLGTAGDVAMHLRRRRVEMPRHQIDEVLDHLVRRDILQQLGGRTFRVRNGLLFLWIRESHDLLTAVRRAPGVHQARPKAVSPWRKRRVDWVSLVLWAVALSLVLAITWLWRTREVSVTWTNEPEPTPPSSGLTLEVLPTPDRGVVPGMLLYIAQDETNRRWAIYRMRPDGSDPMRLTDGKANDSRPVASPDGRRIAFVSDRDGNREIYVMNADGNDQQNLTRNPADDWSPAWSPDGKKIAWASFRDGNWELYMMDASGTGVKRLTATSAADYGPSWSPDGQRIAFVSDRGGNLDIYLLDVASRAVTRFTQDPATDQAPGWSPDGQQILWETSRDGNMEIYTAPVQGDAPPRNLTQDSTSNDHGGCWSPWGRYLVWYTNRDKGWDIYRLDTETGERLNLTASPGLEQWPYWGR